jgi:hypothetical protein
MYTSIRRYRIDKSKMEELTRRVEEGFIPILAKRQGFVSYYLVDGGEGELATISVFDNQEGAEISNALAKEWVEENLGDVELGPPEITAGEIVTHKQA